MQRPLSDAEGKMIDQQRRKSYSMHGKSPFKQGSFGDSPRQSSMQQAPEFNHEVTRQQASVARNAQEPAVFRQSAFNSSQLRRNDTFGDMTPHLPAGPMCFTAPEKLKAPPRPSSLTQGFQQQMGTVVEEARGQMPPPRQPVAASAPATERFTSAFANRTRRPTSVTSHTTNRSNDSGGSSAPGSASEHTTKSDEENLADFI